MPTRRERLEAFTDAVKGSITRESVVRHAVRRGQAREKARLIDEVGSCEACPALLPDASLYHIHHVVPVQRGGTNAASNTVLLCPNCHAIAHWFDRTLPAAERPDDRHSLLARFGVMVEEEQPQTSAWLRRSAR